MFYCKDVKYDMCELKKKIMIRKIKYAKNLNDWIFFFPPSVMSSVSLLLSPALVPQRA